MLRWVTLYTLASIAFSETSENRSKKMSTNANQATIRNAVDSAMKQRAIDAARGFIGSNRTVAETARDYIAAYNGMTWADVSTQPALLHKGLQSLLSLQMGEWLAESNIHLDADSWTTFGKCTAAAMKRSAIAGVKIMCRMRLNHSAPAGRKTPKSGSDVGYDCQRKPNAGKDDSYRFVEYQIVQPDASIDNLDAMPSIQTEFTGDTTAIDVRDLYEQDFPLNPELPARVIGIQDGMIDPVVNETAWAEREVHALRNKCAMLGDKHDGLLAIARIEIANLLNIAQSEWSERKRLELIVSELTAKLATATAPKTRKSKVPA